MTNNQTDPGLESFNIIFWRIMPRKIMIHTVWRENTVEGMTHFFPQKYTSMMQKCVALVPI